jgi:hypothetical protein
VKESDRKLPTKSVVDVLESWRAQWLYTASFTVSVLTTAKALFSSAPAWFLVCGPFWLLTAFAIWLGLKVTLSQHAGRLLWKSLGPTHLLAMQLRAVIFFTVGLGLIATAFYAFVS